MKKLFLLATLMICSVSNGQTYYESIKEELIHIRCEATAIRAEFINGESLDEDEPYKEFYIYAFNDNNLFVHHQKITDSFIALAFKDPDDNEWFLNNFFKPTVLITDNVIKYMSNDRHHSYDRENKRIKTSEKLNFSIDRITATYISDLNRRYVYLDGAGNTMDITWKYRGKCSPYDPD